MMFAWWWCFPNTQDSWSSIQKGFEITLKDAISVQEQYQKTFHILVAQSIKITQQWKVVKWRAYKVIKTRGESVQISENCEQEVSLFINTMH